MINEIVKGISRAIYDEFGNGYAIYKENIPQNFTEPCFSIVHIRSSNDLKLTNRYMRRNLFDIHYFPEDGRNEKEQMYNVAERLFLCLEHIFVLDNMCRGAKMSPEIVDGVLHFFVNYDFFVTRQSDGDDNPMIDINSTTNWEEQTWQRKRK